MRSLSIAALASVAALTVTVVPSAQAQTDSSMQPSMMAGSYTRDMMMSRNDSTGANSIAAIAMSDPQFSTLVKLVKLAGLDNSLMYRGPLTVFAPTNDAFDKLPKGTLDVLMQPENIKLLQGILMYHIVPGGYNAADVTMVSSQGSPMLPTTARMMPLTITSGPAISYGGMMGGMSNSSPDMKSDMSMMGTAHITRPDIMASNGIIHVIDTVLLPPMDMMQQENFKKSVKMAKMHMGKMKTPTLVDQATMAQKTPAQMNKEKPLGGSAADPVPAKMEEKKP